MSSLELSGNFKDVSGVSREFQGSFRGIMGVRGAFIHDVFKAILGGFRDTLKQPPKPLNPMKSTPESFGTP